MCQLAYARGRYACCLGVVPNGFFESTGERLVASEVQAGASRRAAPSCPGEPCTVPVSGLRVCSCATKIRALAMLANTLAVHSLPCGSSEKRRVGYPGVLRGETR